MKELLDALNDLKDTHLIFTMPNADTDGRVIFKMIKEFVENRANAKYFTSLGQLRYLSCIKYVDGVIGNSSSGIIEVPSFKKGTINIGDRQKGRKKAKSIIDCDPTRDSIKEAIDRLYSSDFETILENTINPYGNGGASEAIVSILEEISFEDMLKKSFFDLNH